MRVRIDLPALGFDMESARLNLWSKSVGDAVTEGETIAEIETEKATVELESPATGTIVELCFAAGVDVPVGEVLGYIDDGRP